MTTDQRFLVAFQLSSAARLAKNALIQEPGWHIQLGTGGHAGTITVFDLHEAEEKGGMHAGLAVEVEVLAQDIDGAIRKATEWAEMIGAAISATACAAVGPPLPVIAFGLPVGSQPRPLRRWFRSLPFPPPTRRVDQERLVMLTERVFSAAPETAFAIRMSLQLFRQATKETADVWRFAALWMAAEVLDDPLKTHFRASDHAVQSGAQEAGLATLEVKCGYKPFVRAASRARNDLLHINEVDGEALQAELVSMSSLLEELVPCAWAELLDLGDWADGKPKERTSDHDVELIVHADFVPPDGVELGIGNHPVVALHLTMDMPEMAEGASWSAETQFELTPGHGIASWQLHWQEIRGPWGPISFEMKDSRVVPKSERAPESPK